MRTNRASGVISIKKIKPNSMGLTRLPRIKENFNHAKFAVRKMIGLTRDIIKKIILLVRKKYANNSILFQKKNTNIKNRNDIMTMPNFLFDGNNICFPIYTKYPLLCRTIKKLEESIDKWCKY